MIFWEFSSCDLNLFVYGYRLMEVWMEWFCYGKFEFPIYFCV